MKIKEDKPRHTSKLKALTHLAKKLPEWRSLMWTRLVTINSPWLDYTAMSALSGARPTELKSATYKKENNALVITIQGAMVRATVGQPWRTLILKNDGSEEFKYLFENATEHERLLAAPLSVDPADAFTAALTRAGKKLFSKKVPLMSASVYRHAFLSDLKADNLSKEKIAAAMGHCVTRTQKKTGKASLGTTGQRDIEISSARPIKSTHSVWVG